MDQDGMLNGHEFYERKRTQKLMESQQAQFEHLIDRADDLVVIVNPDYSIIDLNNAAEQFYQCKREAVIGRNLFEIAVEEEWQLPASLLTHRRSIKRISWSVVSLPPRYGQKGYMLTGQVISKSVNASQIFLENILYNIPQYILWKDRNFVYLGCNHNFAKLVGLKLPKVLLAKPILIYGDLKGQILFALPMWKF